jgi:hypothetical protein
LTISTLRDYIEALGGRLEITAVFEDEDRVAVAVGPSTAATGEILPGVQSAQNNGGAH